LLACIEFNSVPKVRPPSPIPHCHFQGDHTTGVCIPHPYGLVVSSMQHLWVHAERFDLTEEVTKRNEKEECFMSPLLIPF
jgi:hypothetical protein